MTTKKLMIGFYLVTVFFKALCIVIDIHDHRWSATIADTAFTLFITSWWWKTWSDR